MKIKKIYRRIKSSAQSIRETGGGGIGVVVGGRGAGGGGGWRSRDWSVALIRYISLIRAGA